MGAEFVGREYKWDGCRMCLSGNTSKMGVECVGRGAQVVWVQNVLAEEHRRDGRRMCW